MNKINLKLGMVVGIALFLIQGCAQFAQSARRPTAPEPIIIVDPKVKELLPQTGLSAVVYGYLVKDENNLEMFAKGDAAFLKQPYSFEIDPRVIVKDFPQQYHTKWLSVLKKEVPKVDTSKMNPKEKKLASRKNLPVDLKLADNYDDSKVTTFKLKFEYGSLTEGIDKLDIQAAKVAKAFDDGTRKTSLPSSLTYILDPTTKLLTYNLDNKIEKLPYEEEIVQKSLTGVSAKMGGITTKVKAKVSFKSALSDSLTTDVMTFNFPKIMSPLSEPPDVGESQLIEIAKLGEERSTELDMNKDWKFVWSPTTDAPPSIISIRISIINGKFKTDRTLQNPINGWGFVDCLDSAGICEITKELRKGSSIEIKDDGVEAELTIYRITPSLFTMTSEDDKKQPVESQGLVLLGVGSTKIVSIAKLKKEEKKK